MGCLGRWADIPSDWYTDHLFVAITDATHLHRMNPTFEWFRTILSERLVVYFDLEARYIQFSYVVHRQVHTSRPECVPRRDGKDNGTKTVMHLRSTAQR